jgi:uncharacterized protein YlxW (UPF0749 family)
MIDLTSRRARHTITALIAAAAGLLFVSSGHTAAGTDIRSGGLDDLRSHIINRAKSMVGLEQDVSELQKEVTALSEKEIDPALRAKIAKLETQAGLSEVTGPALQVILNDAPREVGSDLPTGFGPDDLVVHQQDVQAVVNAFWRGGATAVTVMDQRIISTSAIRCVGNTLLLQGRVYSPPFKITAIGDTAKLQIALNNEPGVKTYRQYVDRVNLGWKINIFSEITLPAWEGSVNPN